MLFNLKGNSGLGGCRVQISLQMQTALKLPQPLALPSSCLVKRTIAINLVPYTYLLLGWIQSRAPVVDLQGMQGVAQTRHRYQAQSSPVLPVY